LGAQLLVDALRLFQLVFEDDDAAGGLDRGARVDEFAGKYGSRFEPNLLLRKKAENGETF